MRQLAFDNAMKMFPYLFPKESTGNTALVNINNGIQINGKMEEKTVLSLADHIKQRRINDREKKSRKLTEAKEVEFEEVKEVKKNDS